MKVPWLRLVQDVRPGSHTLRLPMNVGVLVVSRYVSWVFLFFSISSVDHINVSFFI